jgi:hypothetical protein
VDTLQTIRPGSRYRLGSGHTKVVAHPANRAELFGSPSYRSAASLERAEKGYPQPFQQAVHFCSHLEFSRGAS